MANFVSSLNNFVHLKLYKINKLFKNTQLTQAHFHVSKNLIELTIKILILAFKIIFDYKTKIKKRVHKIKMF